MELRAGEPVRLVLMQRLSSGGSKEGDEVLFLVADDLRSDGTVVVPAGSIARGEVTRSRGATAITALVNQPARLEIRLTSVRGPGGVEVPIRSMEAEAHAFTRENTDRKRGDLDLVWSDADKRALLERLARGMISGEGFATFEDPEVKRKIQALSTELGLTETAQFLKSPPRDTDLFRLQQRLEKGDVSGLGANEALLALGALGELSQLATMVDDRLRGIFKGRNIVAPVGLELDAVIGENVTLTLPPAAK